MKSLPGHFASLSKAGAQVIGRFEAMACPCEVLMDTDDAAEGKELCRLAESEARRIEAKFSRYLSGNAVHLINSSRGEPIQVDAETSNLLDFAQQCYRLSDGLFDITSGILRKLWKFDGSDRLPSAAAVAELLTRVGWDKVRWSRPTLVLPPGMEIDLGGMGKEYAVDRTVQLLQNQANFSVLVNFGGDIAVAGRRRDGEPWTVGIESATEEGRPVRIIKLVKGALATSGDSKKFLLKDGKRYSHILDPRTGYPVEGSPRSVTVAAGVCTEAGFLSTLGMLQGSRR